MCVYTLVYCDTSVSNCIRDSYFSVVSKLNHVSLSRTQIRGFWNSYQFWNHSHHKRINLHYKHTSATKLENRSYYRILDYLARGRYTPHICLSITPALIYTLYVSVSQLLLPSFSLTQALFFVWTIPIFLGKQIIHCSSCHIFIWVFSF